MSKDTVVNVDSKKLEAMQYAIDTASELEIGGMEDKNTSKRLRYIFQKAMQQEAKKLLDAANEKITDIVHLEARVLKSDLATAEQSARERHADLFSSLDIFSNLYKSFQK